MLFTLFFGRRLSLFQLQGAARSGQTRSTRATCVLTLKKLLAASKAAETFSPSVQQAMFAANGKVVEKILSSTELPLAARLNERGDNDVITEELFLATLGRLPDEEERTHTVSYLTQRADRQPSAIRQILWALFNSAEFRMKH